MIYLHQSLNFNRPSGDLLELFKEEEGLFFLDSSLNSQTDGRYSYLGFSPFKKIEALDFKELRQLLKPYLKLKHQGMFRSGAVGYLAYNGKIKFNLYNTVLCLDHQKSALDIHISNFESISKTNAQKIAQQKLEYILFKLNNPPIVTNKTQAKKIKLAFKSNTTKAQYIKSVNKALKHIYEGDIYQINLAHRFDAVLPSWPKGVHPIDIYQQLRVVSPSEFSAFLDDGGRYILSSSPERFLKLEGSCIQVRPMKGTRPRGKNPQEDARYYNELLHSAKEKAELLMVTDLERNDLGRVCQFGQVKVTDLRRIESYNTVFQATSTVTGQLNENYDQFDLLQSTFPSGSVTGCPKIEAMKIIQKLEKSKRFLYTGALGYINFNGDMDFNVLIRTIFIQKNKISFYVGGGIVADSNPQKEYEETLLKAKGMIEALQRSFSK